MSKELFVTSTPHETKVGLVEDDQLAEIYLERENEYTLAGSIYKGRVTRVLPGMQSAFVDIGLERDAFLYVSDFMELEEQEDDLNDVVPTNRPAVSESRPQPARSEAPAAAVPADAASYVIESEPFADEGPSESRLAAAEPATVAEPGTGEGPARERGGFRNRRRRRGRRFEDDRGNRSERRFHRSSESASPVPADHSSRRIHLQISWPRQPAAGGRFRFPRTDIPGGFPGECCEQLSRGRAAFRGRPGRAPARTARGRRSSGRGGPPGVGTRTRFAGPHAPDRRVRWRARPRRHFRGRERST